MISVLGSGKNWRLGRWNPVRDVPPGLYVLRIEARGGQDARAMREVPVRIW